MLYATWRNIAFFLSANNMTNCGYKSQVTVSLCDIMDPHLLHIPPPNFTD